MNVIAIDPGETTGVAVMINGTFMYGMVVKDRMFQKDDFYYSLMKLGKPDYVVVEKPPTASRFPNKIQTTVFDICTKWFSRAGIKVIIINPGQWKGLIDRSTVSSTHIKDAMDMAKWFVRTQENNNVG